MNGKALRFSALFEGAISKTKPWLEKVYFPTWVTPFALAIIVFLSYGLKISDLGFYWDGLVFINIFNRAESDIFVDVFRNNRPLTSILYSITTRVLKDVPIRWHIFGLICRWMSAVALWWTLRELWRELWPRKMYQATWIAFLFAIYPSFTQQSISVVYSLHFLTFTVFIISMGAMIKAYRKNQWFWWLVSWLGAGYSMFALEYYIGLEIIRPVILWLLIDKKKYPQKKRLRKTLILWSPYLFIGLGFIVWRFFFLTSPMYDVVFLTNFVSEPFGTLKVLFDTILSDLLEVTYLAWEQTLQGEFLLGGHSQKLAQYIWVVASTGIFTFLYRLKLRTESGDVTGESHPGQPKVMIILGFLFIISAGVPVWSVPLDIDLSFPTDRFTLPMMIGTSILIVGLIEMVTKSKLKKILILALMVGTAAGFHLRSAEIYQIERNLQKHFIWNLVWRMPYLKPGTVILGDGYPFLTTDDEAITALINLSYISDGNEDDLPYGFFFISGALGGDELPALEKGQLVKSRYGPLTFSGTTSQAVSIYYSGDHCPRILTPEYDDYGKIYPGLLSETIHLSDTSNILDEKEMIDRGNLIRYYGEEPTITWCYSYQKAELARQLGKWPRIVNLGKWTFKPGYQYLAPEELFPFIEGYAMTGDFERAAELTYEALSNTRTLRPELCKIWDRVHEANFSEDNKPIIFVEVNNELDCSSFD